MTVNDIGDEGAKTLCEILKSNTTLTELNLKRVKRKGKRKKRKER